MTKSLVQPETASQPHSLMSIFLSAVCQLTLLSFFSTIFLVFLTAGSAHGGLSIEILEPTNNHKIHFAFDEMPSSSGFIFSGVAYRDIDLPTPTNPDDYEAWESYYETRNDSAIEWRIYLELSKERVVLVKRVLKLLQDNPASKVLLSAQISDVKRITTGELPSYKFYHGLSLAPSELRLSIGTTSSSLESVLEIASTFDFEHPEKGNIETLIAMIGGARPSPSNAEGLFGKLKPALRKASGQRLSAVAAYITDKTGDWLGAIADGQDFAAAKYLLKYSDHLPKNQSEDFRGLVERTASSLAESCDCDEKDRVTLFRGLHLGQTDTAIPTNGRRFLLPSRALMTEDRQLRSDGLTANLAAISVDDMRHIHSNVNYSIDIYRNSYLISTSFSPAQASVASKQIAIIRPCTKRVISTITGYGESELLLPFFIHPNEIVAVIQNYDVLNSAGIEQGKFRLLYNGTNRTDSDARDWIAKLAHENQSDSRRIRKELHSWSDTIYQGQRRLKPNLNNLRQLRPLVCTDIFRSL